nr:RNA-directed DNA polymerase, eukaryota [Tanacetum cinerariifolium]
CGLSNDGDFKVKDIRIFLDDLILPHSELTRWIKAMPIKINIFAWRARKDCVPTRMNLVQRDNNIYSVLCPLMTFPITFYDKLDSIPECSTKASNVSKCSTKEATVLERSMIEANVPECSTKKATKDVASHIAAKNIVDPQTEDEEFSSSSAELVTCTPVSTKKSFSDEVEDDTEEEAEDDTDEEA